MFSVLHLWLGWIVLQITLHTRPQTGSELRGLDCLVLTSVHSCLRGRKTTGTVETSAVFKRGTVNTSPAPLSWEFPESSIFLAPNFNSENKNNDRLVIAEDCGEEK